MSLSQFSPVEEQGAKSKLNDRRTTVFDKWLRNVITKGHFKQWNFLKPALSVPIAFISIELFILHLSVTFAHWVIFILFHFFLFSFLLKKNNLPPPQFVSKFLKNVYSRIIAWLKKFHITSLKKYTGKMKVKRVSKFSKSGNTDIFPIGRKP